MHYRLPQAGGLSMTTVVAAPQRKKKMAWFGRGLGVRLGVKVGVGVRVTWGGGGGGGGN